MQLPPKHTLNLLLSQHTLVCVTQSSTFTAHLCVCVYFMKQGFGRIQPPNSEEGVTCPQVKVQVTHATRRSDKIKKPFGT